MGLTNKCPKDTSSETKRKKTFSVKIIGEHKKNHGQHNFSLPNKNIFTLSSLTSVIRTLISICHNLYTSPTWTSKGSFWLWPFNISFAPIPLYIVQLQFHDSLKFFYCTILKLERYFIPTKNIKLCTEHF